MRGVLAAAFGLLLTGGAAAQSQDARHEGFELRAKLEAVEPARSSGPFVLRGKLEAGPQGRGRHAEGFALKASSLSTGAGACPIDPERIFLDGFESG